MPIPSETNRTQKRLDLKCPGTLYPITPPDSENRTDKSECTECTVWFPTKEAYICSIRACEAILCSACGPTREALEDHWFLSGGEKVGRNSLFRVWTDEGEEEKMAKDNKG